MSSDKTSSDNSANNTVSNSDSENTITPFIPQENTHSESEANHCNNVINLFTGQVVNEEIPVKIVRLAAESEGLRMLYASYDNPERLVAVPILCWALTESGNIIGMVPWLDEVLPCNEIEEKYSVSWEGYYCMEEEEIFFEAPPEIVAQLTAAARFSPRSRRNIIEMGQQNSALAHDTCTLDVIQEIPDSVGTHALLFSEDDDSLILTSVISWALDNNGEIHGMLTNEDAVEKLPVLPGDDCLFSANSAKKFKCFFQRDIAEQIRTQNPETLAAIEQLFVQ